MTALGNPALLERMSACIVELRNLFQKFDTQVGKTKNPCCCAVVRPFLFGPLHLYHHGTDQIQHLTIHIQGQGHITRAQFVEGYNKYFLDDSSSSTTTTTATSSSSGSTATPAERVDPALDRLLAKLDPKGKDRIDYIEWSNTLTLRDVPALTRQGWLDGSA